MARSHTCHDNPLYLWDEKRFCTKLNAKDEENTPDFENNHSTNSLTSNPRMPPSKVPDPEKHFENKCTSTDNRKMNENCFDGNYIPTVKASEVEVIEQRCKLCELSHPNQNNINEMHG